MWITHEIISGPRIFWLWELRIDHRILLHKKYSISDHYFMRYKHFSIWKLLNNDPIPSKPTCLVDAKYLQPHWLYPQAKQVYLQSQWPYSKQSYLPCKRNGSPTVNAMDPNLIDASSKPSNYSSRSKATCLVNAMDSQSQWLKPLQNNKNLLSGLCRAYYF